MLARQRGGIRCAVDGRERVQDRRHGSSARRRLPERRPIWVRARPRVARRFEGEAPQEGEAPEPSPAPPIPP